MRLRPAWLLIWLSAITAWQAAADEPQRHDLWNGRAPLGDGKVEENEVWTTVYRPAQANGAAIVICPGGGYAGHAIQPEGHGIARWLGRHGVTGVVLEYRLPAGRHQVPLLDAQRAIRWVRAHAQEWNVDSERIGILGFSAGGHLASTAATHFDGGDPSANDPVERVSCRPDFAILIYPVVTMGDKTHQGSRKNLLGNDPSPELIERYSNERQVSKATPPMFLAHAANDGPVPPDNSRRLFQALQAQQIAAKFLELPSGGHGLNGYQGPMWDAWQQQSLAWLREQEFLPPAEPIDLSNPDAVRARRPILIAHRGGVVTPYSPECSSAAIRKASQDGYDLVELDIRGTKDHVPIVFHDRHLSPATDGTGNVEDLDFDQLADVRYRHVDEKILTLDSALKLCKSLGLGVMLDAKEINSDTMPVKIAELIRAHGMERSTMALNSDPRVVVALADVSLLNLKVHEKKLKSGVSGRPLTGYFWFGLPHDLPESDVTRLQNQGALIIPAINTFRYAADSHLESAQADIRRLQQLGVDGFQIDSIYQENFGLAPALRKQP